MHRKLNSSKNKLFFGDNLEILEDRTRFPDASVDLIYLDPPFNSNADYNTLFRHADGTPAAAQTLAFTDTWKWDEKAAHVLWDFQSGGIDAPEAVVNAVVSLHKLLGNSSMSAYVLMMTPRLLQLRRVLKSTGSIYLHCDATASHYLKILMDSVFGARNFRNEIVWCYTGPGRTLRHFPRKHDTILFYAKGPNNFFDREAVRMPYKNLSTDQGRGIIFGEAGQLKNPKVRRSYLERGKVPEDWWDERHHGMTPVGRIKNERMGYPTQKPLALLERIIKASSNQGDLILDPFCGCGTAVVAAQKLQRRWIGIDITHLAVDLIRQRLKDEKVRANSYEIVGSPTTIQEARALFAKDPFQFEHWAISRLPGIKRNDRQRGDKGIDGIGRYKTDDQQGFAKCVVQVKGGKKAVVAEMRDFRHVVEANNADFGIFLVMDEKAATAGVKESALEAGFYKTAQGVFPFECPKVQVCSIEAMFADRPPLLPKLFYD